MSYVYLWWNIWCIWNLSGGTLETPSSGKILIACNTSKFAWEILRAAWKILWKLNHVWCIQILYVPWKNFVKVAWNSQIFMQIKYWSYVNSICWLIINFYSESKHWDLCGLRPLNPSILQSCHLSAWTTKRLLRVNERFMLELVIQGFFVMTTYYVRECSKIKIYMNHIKSLRQLTKTCKTSMQARPGRAWKFWKILYVTKPLLNDYLH